MRGRSPDGYLGAVVFVRRSDGLVVELGSAHFVYRALSEVFESVFRDIGETADAEAIKAEIIARSEAYSAEHGLVEDVDESIDELVAALLDAEHKPREPGA